MNALDIERPEDLRADLLATRRIDPGERIDLRNLAGGVSNRTVRVDLPDRPATWVLKQALAKLRVAVDWFSDPARIEREALALQWLPRFAPPDTITPLIFQDVSCHLLAMEAVAQPHENWKSTLLAGKIDRDHVEQFATILSSIHRGSSEAGETVREVFNERGFFESLRLEPYYAYSAEQVPESRSFLNQLIADTQSRRLSLVHGDFSPKNILVHAGRLVLLDHEVIHWGDPAFDIGFAMTHFLSKAHHLPAFRDAFVESARRFTAIYAAGVGRDRWDAGLETMAARHTLGCLMARVAGRSPLEYLTAQQRSRQRNAVVSLMTVPPASMDGLIDSFFRAIADADDFSNCRV